MTSLVLLALAIVAGTTVGYAFGGQASNISRVRISWWGLAIAAIASQYLPLPTGTSKVDLAARVVVFAACAAAAFTFAFKNLHLWPVVLVAVGLTSNFLVVAVYGRMLVSAEALRAAGLVEVIPPISSGDVGRYRLIEDGDALAYLSDIFGLPEPLGVIGSIGDVFVFAGVVGVTAVGMRLAIAQRRSDIPRTRAVVSGSPQVDDDAKIIAHND